MDGFHRPVMVTEVVAALRPRAGAVVVDGTVGGGGHAEAILESTAPDGILIGIDADGEALAAAGRRLARFGKRAILVKGNFADMEGILAEQKIGTVDGILLDLGVSSHQLDSPERGFSFSQEAPLDMRMDRSRPKSAADLVNSLPWEELARIIKGFGEERMAGRIARAIVAERNRSPIRTTTALAGIVVRTLPPGTERQKIHPATRTFQALRIAVNDELTSLRRAIEDGTERLKPEGRFSIISFHSLEDRIVKNAFRAGEKGCTCPPDLPVCGCNGKPKLRVITRKPVTPGDEELGSNPRARSAKLRTAERI
ncbi:MAG: 16S rRNA (cytosine(1402)-N(4))-methyltransferase RsmH [Syntrophales bacterium]